MGYSLPDARKIQEMSLSNTQFLVYCGQLIYVFIYSFIHHIYILPTSQDLAPGDIYYYVIPQLSETQEAGLLHDKLSSIGSN